MAVGADLQSLPNFPKRRDSAVGQQTEIRKGCGKSDQTGYEHQTVFLERTCCQQGG